METLILGKDVQYKGDIWKIDKLFSPDGIALWVDGYRAAFIYKPGCGEVVKLEDLILILSTDTYDISDEVYVMHEWIEKINPNAIEFSMKTYDEVEDMDIILYVERIYNGGVNAFLKDNFKIHE